MGGVGAVILLMLERLIPSAEGSDVKSAGEEGRLGTITEPRDLGREVVAEAGGGGEGEVVAR